MPPRRASLVDRLSPPGSRSIRTSAAALITHPRRHAAFLSVAYGLIGVGYILISGQVAAALSATKLQLYEIELLKGLGFVAVTAVLLYFMALGYLQRLEVKEEEARRDREIAMAADRRAAAGLFAASVAHDINNVLMVNAMALERLAGRPNLADDLRPLVATLGQANTRLKDLVLRLGRAGGADTPTGTGDLDLAGVVAQVVELAGHHQKLKACRIETRGPAHLRLKGDADLVHRMVLNLLLNAADATGHQGRILVVLRNAAGQALLEVHDDGPGIPVEEREKIFQPLYSTKADGSGLGLLSVTLCARAHGGTAVVTDSELGGACFQVELGPVLGGAESSAA